MANKKLTIALDFYDRHVPFFLGLVEPPAGFDLEALEVGMVPPRRHGIDRHGRMLRDREFDIAEVSLASYIMAREQGCPVVAVPAFPRRLFTQSHIFVAENSPYRTPADLRGKRVAIWAFQVTMSVLAKGDFARDHGLDWRDVTWMCQYPEQIPWEAEGEVDCVERLPEGADIHAMLLSGEIDAFINPHPPGAMLTQDSGIRWLYGGDTRSVCADYVARHGYFPIMHVLAVREDTAAAHPEIPREAVRMWDDAVRHTAHHFEDQSYSYLALARDEFVWQRERLGSDIWVSGLNANRKNLEDFIGWMVDQRLLDRPVSVESLFHPSVRD